jgi:glycosyltransferase involved in cell wall biosynthesis
MVFKLKELEGNSPGIIIFSHKEFIKYSKYKTFNKILKAYEKNYFFGVHWGASFEKTSEFNFENIDLNFAYKEMLPHLDLKNNTLIPLITRSFIPSDIFKEDEKIEKIYDVITVTRKVNVKFNLDLFNIYRELIKQNPQIKILILVSNPNYIKSNFDHLFDYNFNNILGNFENVELVNFTDTPDQTTVAKNLQKSKMFLFTSRKEGGVKVTAEAALCNLPVLINKSFFGGARVGINPKYLFEYDSISTAVKHINAYINPDAHLDKVFMSDLVDKDNLLKLKKSLKSFYKSKNRPFEGRLDTLDLKNRMNSNLKELPNEYVTQNNDLKSLQAVSKYFSDFCFGQADISNLDFLFDRIKNYKLNIDLKHVILTFSPVWFIKIVRKINAQNKMLSYE